MNIINIHIRKNIILCTITYLYTTFKFSGSIVHLQNMRLFRASNNNMYKLYSTNLYKKII